jgi:FecR protein
VTRHRLWLVVFALVSCLRIETALAIPTTAGVDPMPVTMDRATPGLTMLAQAQTPAAPEASPTPAPSPTSAASDEPIGNVATLSGVATVIRNKDSIALKLKDDIFLNDTVQTAADSVLGVTFNDGTTFHLSANARITIDNYVYEDGAKDNAGTFDIGKGTVAFVAALVAKTGDMKITTPTSTLGIRGTTGLVEVPEGGAAAGGRNNVNIKLYPDPDGHVGRIEVNDRTGTRLGALTQGASGFSIRPPSAPGGRVSALPLQISSQQAARDQGFVRQVHAAQNVGRQIVTEQRAIRRANPNAAPNRNTPPRQPTPQPQPSQRPNGLPGQKGQPQPGATPNRQGQQPGTKPPAVPPNRQGSQQPGKRPDQPPQQGQPQRSGQTPQQNEKPGTSTQPARQPRPGETPRPGENRRPDNPRTGEKPGTPSEPNLHEPGLRQGAPNLPRPGVLRPPRPGRPAATPAKRPPPKGKRQEPPQ